MTTMYRRTHFALVLFAALIFALDADVVATAEPLPTLATPNHDQDHVSLMRAVAESMPAEVDQAATPNHDPYRANLMQAAAAPVPDEILANTVILRAEPEAAEPAPVFIAADTTVYARANARLRAAPNTAAGIMAKLVANAPLHAIARSNDGAWWQVSLANSRTGYVHRDAVTTYQVVKLKPPAAPAATPPVATASLPNLSVRRSQSMLGLVDEAMNWLSDVAAQGSPPKIVRAER
jgi:uncharacterized protein YgiM (DUF1202 family)